jgi:PII-like signaling protein
MARVESTETLLRIFVGERDRAGHRSLYEALVELCRQEGASGATVLRGIAGFGSHRVFHSDKLLDLSLDLPLVVEVVEKQEKIDQLLPKLEELMGEKGVITLEKVTVRRPGR